MKSLPISALVSGTLLFVAFQAGAVPLFTTEDKWMNSKVNPSTQTLPLDEALLNLSPVLSANILADATNFPATLDISPYGARKVNRYETSLGTRISVVGVTSKQGNLTHDRSGRDTFVFWDQPDVKKLLPLLVAFQKQRAPATSPETNAATVGALKEFLQRNYGWKADAQTSEEKTQRAQGVPAFGLTDLPRELQGPVQAEFYRATLGLTTNTSYRWFEDDLWAKARLRLNMSFQAVYDEQGNYLGERKGPRVEFTFPNSPNFWDLGSPHWNPEAPILPPEKSRPLSPKMLAAIAEIKAARLAGTIPPIPDYAPDSPEPPVSNPVAALKTVTFSVKRQPLAAFVSNLQKQSGISLSLAPDVAPRAKVTGRSLDTGMTLDSAMNALARLYCAHWEKEGEGFVLRSNGWDELRQGMARLGDSAFYGWMTRWPQESIRVGTERADEILGGLDVDQLNAEGGAAFADLPADTQQSAMQFVREENEGELFTAQQRLYDVLEQDVRFRFGTVQPPVVAEGFVSNSPVPFRFDNVQSKTPLFFDGFSMGNFRYGYISTEVGGLAAYSSDGRFIAQLFPDFQAQPPSELDRIMDTHRQQDKERAAGQ